MLRLQKTRIAVVKHIEIKPMKGLSDLKARFRCDKTNVHFMFFLSKSFFVQLPLKISFLFGINVPLVFFVQCKVCGVISPSVRLLAFFTAAILELREIL